MKQVIQAFDKAAPAYDAASALQQQVAQKLVAHAQIREPKQILDIGCGTGHVSALAAQKYPQASLTAIDASPAMLHEAQKKLPKLKTILADAAQLTLPSSYDLIFSSMALHWLPEPHLVLQKWKKLMAPGGKLYVALPVAGSLQEWRDLCRAHNIKDGLWNFPAPNFAKNIAAQMQIEKHPIHHDSLHGFLHQMKQSGAHRAYPGHIPASPVALRRLLATHQGPFTATYDILYLEAG